MPWPGVSCNKVYVDLSKPYYARAFATSGGGTLYQHLAVVPYRPALANIELMTQVAFEDSRTKALRLSQAALSRLGKPWPYLARSMVVDVLGKPYGNVNSGGSEVPIIRYW